MRGTGTTEQFDRSGFTDIDATDVPADYIARLDNTAAEPFWEGVESRLLSVLDLREGDRVLDVGCGTGDDVRTLARLLGPTGSAVGVDSSAAMITEAQRRSYEVGTGEEFYLGDACRLPFPDDTFDACRGERVLQHIARPERAVAEMIRVTRPGGRVVAVEPDYGAVNIGGADPEVTKRIVSHRCARYASGTIGRRLPGLFRSGLITLGATIFRLSTEIMSPSERQLLSKWAGTACQAGVISVSERDDWLHDLEVAACGGRYRRAIPVFLVAGRKP